MTALDAANLFATPMEKIGVLHQRLADLAMANPGVWRISHSDIFLGEDFDSPPSQRRPRGEAEAVVEGAQPWPQRRPYQGGLQ